MPMPYTERVHQATFKPFRMERPNWLFSRREGGENTAKSRAGKPAGKGRLTGAQMKANEASLQGLKLMIEGDEWAVAKEGKSKAQWKWKIDPSRDPKELDFIQEMDGKETVTRCLYEFKDGTLTVCQDLASPEKRPSKLIAENQINLTVWKRAEK